MNPTFGSAGLSTDLAERLYPRLFEYLRASGWTPIRRAGLPSIDDALGFVLHRFARDFLLSFNGLTLRFEDCVGTDCGYNDVRCGVGSDLQAMDPSRASVYVGRIVGTSFVYPVVASGDSVGFVLEDGSLVAIDAAWRGCAWSPDPFQWMHVMLFGEHLPGIEIRELSMMERPPMYRWE